MNIDFDLAHEDWRQVKVKEERVKMDIDFDLSLKVLKEVCRVNENHPGYVANTMRKLYDEKTFNLEQWQALASASDKTKKWAAQQWAMNQGDE